MIKPILPIQLVLALCLAIDLGAQCDTDPIFTDTPNDITIESSTFGDMYCPGTDADIAEGDSEGPAVAESGDTGTPDCDVPTVYYENTSWSGDMCNDVLTRTWIADYGSNGDGMETYEQTITIIDDTDPVINTCPPDVLRIVGCDEEDPGVAFQSGYPYSASTSSNLDLSDFVAIGGDAEDECGIEFINYIDDLVVTEGNCMIDEPHIEITRTWTVIDFCGNEVTCEQLITVIDEDEPLVMCPFNQMNLNGCDEDDPIIESDTGFPYAGTETEVDLSDFEAWGSVTENCEVLMVTYGDDLTITQDNCPNAHVEITRLWTVTDVCGNTATCEQMISLLDTEEPDVPSISDVEIFDTEAGIDCDEFHPDIEGLSGFPYNPGPFEIDAEDFPAGEITDNCEVFMVTYSDVITDMDCPNPIFTIERTWEAVDFCGNEIVPIIQLIHIIDMTRPVFDYDQDDIIINSTDDCIEIYDAWDPPVVDVDVTDNCGQDLITLIATFEPGDEFPAGVNEVLYTATDECGNESTYSFNIIVNCIDCQNAGVLYEECPDSPVFCDLDDLQGLQSCTPIYDGNVGGSLCGGGVFNNTSWITFVAGSENVAITITPGDCTPGDGGSLGLQAGIYDNCPPGGGCLAGGANCEVGEFTISGGGFIPGNVYHFFVDGCAGSECNYSIVVDQFQPFDIPDPDEVLVETSTGQEADEYCPDLAVLFDLGPDFVEYNFDFFWEITGPGAGPLVEVVSEGAVLEYTFEDLGEYEVCMVFATNDCDEIDDPVCTMITIALPEDVDFGAYKVCESYAPWEGPDEGSEEWQGDFISEDGTYMAVAFNDLGCAYNQFVTVDIYETPEEEEVVFHLCPEQVQDFEYLGVSWEDLEDDYLDEFDYGIYEGLVELEEGSEVQQFNGDYCDTLVYLIINIYQLPGEIVATSTGCNVSVNYAFDIETPVFINPNSVDYEWWSTGGVSFGDEDTALMNEPGTYVLEMTYETEDGDMCLYEIPFDLDASLFNQSAPGAPGVEFNNVIQICDSETDLVQAILSNPSPDLTAHWILPPNMDSLVSSTTNILEFSITDMSDLTFEVYYTSVCDDGSLLLSATTEVTVEIQPSPVANFNLPEEHCISDLLTVNYIGSPANITNFNWVVEDPSYVSSSNPLTGQLILDFPTEGMQVISLQLTDVFGCESSIYIDSVFIQDVIDTTQFMCSSTNNTVTFSWNEVDDVGSYDLMVLDAPGAATYDETAIAGNTFVVSNIVAGDEVTIQLSVTDNTICGDVLILEHTCIANNCPDVVIDLLLPVGILDTICRDNANPDFTLEPQVAGTSLTGTFMGGNIDGTSGLVDISALAEGENKFYYSIVDGSCSWVDSVSVFVFDLPVADLSTGLMDVCIDQTVDIMTVESPNAVYQYNFNGASSEVANADGYTLSYDDVGLKTITVIADNNGCITLDTVLVNIMDTIQTPNIRCKSIGVDFVEFEWDFTTEKGYEVYIDGVLIGIQDSLDFYQGGLTTLQNVMIEVIALDPECGNKSNTFNCQSNNCPDYPIEFVTTDTIFCFEPGGLQFDLNDFVSNIPSGLLNLEWREGSNILADGMLLIDSNVDSTYTIGLSGSDVDACPGSNSFTISIVSKPSAEFSLSVDTICIGEPITISLDFDPTGLQLMWSDASITEIDPTTFEILYNSPGEQTIGLTTTLGGTCVSDLVENTVMILEPLAVMFAHDLDYCYSIGDEISLQAVNPNTGEPIEGMWMGDGIEDNGTLISLDSDQLDSVFIFTFMESNCNTTQTTEITINEQPFIQLDALTDAICIEDSTTILVTSNHPDDVIFLGDLPVIFNGVSPEFTVTFDNEGLNELEAFIDHNGCISDTSATIVEVEPQVILPNVSEIQCLPGTSSIELNWPTTDCTSEYELFIDGQSEGRFEETEFTIEDLAQGQMVDIAIVYYSECLCPGDTLRLSCEATECPLATIDFNTNDTIRYCMDELPSNIALTANVNGISGGDGTWTGTQIDNQGDVNSSQLSAGTYTYAYAYEAGDCAYKDSIELEIFNNPQIEIFDVIDALCVDDTQGQFSLDLMGDGPFELSIDGNTISQPAGIYTSDIEVGNHTVSIIDPRGCAISSSFEVIAPDQYDLEIMGDSIIQVESINNYFLNDFPEVYNSIVITANGEVICDTDCEGFQWTPTESGPQEICAFVIYLDGSCELLECRTIEVEPIREIFISNVFTPDGDGNNDDWMIFSSELELALVKLQLFDRWGNLILSIENEQQIIGSIVVWDGTFNGDLVEAGVYVYYVEFNEDGKIENRVGDVTVIR